MSQVEFPTETVDLPSKGLIYPKEHPFSKGTAEIKYMTAKEEDILTNSNYLQQGTVLDKLLESVLIDKVNPKDIHPGDKNALFLAVRILGYGSKYNFIYGGEPYELDLQEFNHKEFPSDKITERGTIKFTLPASEREVELNFLTERQEEAIEDEIKGLQKITKNSSSRITVTLKHTIHSLDNNTDKNYIKTEVEKMLARDSRAIRSFLSEVQPNVDMTFKTKEGKEVQVPMGLSFFWPDFE